MGRGKDREVLPVIHSVYFLFQLTKRTTSLEVLTGDYKTLVLETHWYSLVSPPSNVRSSQIRSLTRVPILVSPRSSLWSLCVRYSIISSLNNVRPRNMTTGMTKRERNLTRRRKRFIVLINVVYLCHIHQSVRPLELILFPLLPSLSVLSRLHIPFGGYSFSY